MGKLVGKGNFIGGAFVTVNGEPVTSQNPANNFEEIFIASTSPSHVDLAVLEAKRAYGPWCGLPQEHRNRYLLKLKSSFIEREEDMARAISLEMGKPIGESLSEAKNLSARVDLMITHGLSRVATEEHNTLRGEARYHPQGPVAILGPYNFPAHLVNAHVIPALLTGNTVVVKPSEVCPFVAEIYAECVQKADLPAGVFNMIQGGADVGKALTVHPLIRGVFFTGSYTTGRAIKEMLLDDPHKILALEMGGKNIAVVLQDADLFQALSEIVQGAFLTTGQRCTATSRVFLQRAIADKMIDSLISVCKSLKPKDPFDPLCTFGPLATKQSLARYLRLLESVPSSSAEILLRTEQGEGGAFITPSLNLRKENSSGDAAYFREELFGPNLCIEIVHDLEDAINRTNESSYGLSNAIFTASQSAFEHFYRETFSGVLNHNRSTNGALGQLPFGGVGMSGNQRAAGIDAVRYTTFPVAINTLPFGETQIPTAFKNPIQKTRQNLELPTDVLAHRQDLETFLSLRGFQILDARGRDLLLSMKQLKELHLNGSPFDGAQLIESLEPFARIDEEALCMIIPESGDAFIKSAKIFFERLSNENATFLSRRPAAEIHIPINATLPQSEAMLQRLYKNDFVPREKKTPVIDLQRSKGPYLTSIDEDPLTIFDAASQIASLGAGFQSGIYLDALDTGKLTSAIVANTVNNDSNTRYSEFLLSHAWPGLKYATFVSSGAEANEKAFDLCRLNGLKGRRIIAFEGSFHGRTLMSLQSTFNPQKRGLFEFAGFEATFIPYPAWKDPRDEPRFPNDWVKNWHDRAEIHSQSDDTLLASEIASLNCLKTEIEKGDVACVIIEPMQCEGGDNYATSRFFNGLRALTRGLNVPLIFDEVQTGFSLLGPFFAHSAFDLRDINGKQDGPDCVTLAKKAQLGVVLSTWPDTRSQSCHTLQIERGLLQAKALESFDTRSLETQLGVWLKKIQDQYPQYISSPRAKGYAFAFDLPSNHLANQIINQRFYRGYMVYIAGEKTMRFRLNMKTTQHELDQLFCGIMRSIDDVAVFANKESQKTIEEAYKSYQSPAWVPGIPRENREPNTEQVSIERLTPEAFDKHEADIARLEEEAYEPGRRDTMEYLRNFVTQIDGLALFMLDAEKMVIGYAIGGPIENSDADGPKQDPMRGRNNTFYSTNLLVAPHMRGLGLGLALKKAQIDHVRAMKNTDATARYEFMCGRNRIDFTAEMGAINRLFGAYSVKTYEKQYGHDNAKALYYRIPLRRPYLSLEKPQPLKNLDWASSIQTPFGQCPNKVFDDLINGHFTSAVATKLTLSNWVTPEFVRYGELLQNLAPAACKHTYFTSGRDEVNDKAVRCLRVSRPKGQLMIGLRGQFLGTTTAVSRSLTEPSEFAQPFSWFDWPLAPNPAQAGEQASIEAIETLIKQHTPEQILGMVVELVGEKTGDVLSDSFLGSLDRIRAKTGVPIVFVETASSFGRNGKSLFLSDACQVNPNLVLWYTGAQLGHVFVDDQYYVSKPLTLISTWDGDEVSIRRCYRHLLLAREALATGIASFFESELSKAGLTDRLSGLGLWRSAQFQSAAMANDFIRNAASRGLILESGFNDRVMLTPHLGSTKNEISQGVTIIKELL